MKLKVHKSESLEVAAVDENQEEVKADKSNNDRSAVDRKLGLKQFQMQNSSSKYKSFSSQISKNSDLEQGVTAS